MVKRRSQKNRRWLTAVAFDHPCHHQVFRSGIQNGQVPFLALTQCFAVAEIVGRLLEERDAQILIPISKQVVTLTDGTVICKDEKK